MDLESRLEQTIARHRAGLIDEALAEYKGYLENAPNNENIHHLIGICYGQELHQIIQAIIAIWLTATVT